MQKISQASYRERAGVQREHADLRGHHNRGAIRHRNLRAGSTPVHAAHVTEPRSAINTLRTQVFGLPAFNFTDPTLTAGSAVIKAFHISELRAALADAYAAAGQTPPNYTDPTITATATPIRASHILELRAAVQALE